MNHLLILNGVKGCQRFLLVLLGWEHHDLWNVVPVSPCHQQLGALLRGSWGAEGWRSTVGGGGRVLRGGGGGGVGAGQKLVEDDGGSGVAGLSGGTA